MDASFGMNKRDQTLHSRRNNPEPAAFSVPAPAKIRKKNQLPIGKHFWRPFIPIAEIFLPNSIFNILRWRNFGSKMPQKTTQMRSQVFFPRN
jgi:hypothetical protein